MTCPKCERTNPPDARYCIYCAANLMLEAPVVQEVAPAVGPTVRLSQDQPPIYTMPAPAPAPASVPQPAAPSIPNVWRHNSGVFGALFLIGLGLLFLIDGFFPGILVLVGIIGFLREAASGRSRNALSTLVFFTGLAVLFWIDFIFPGILILLGLIALLNAGRGFRF